MKDRLIKDIEIRIATFCPGIDKDAVMRQILTAIRDYDVTERVTDVAIRHEDINERILKRYVACLRVGGNSESTVGQYVSSCVRLAKLIGRPYSEMTATDIWYYLGELKTKGNQNRSVENQRANLSAFFHWMQTEEIIAVNPCDKVKPIKCEEKIKPHFSAVQMDALRSACKTVKERAMVEVLVSSGVRCAELRNLNVSDVDFKAKTLIVRNGKGGKGRKTFISDVAVSYLEKYLASRKDDLDFLFYSQYKKRYSSKGIAHVLNRIAERSGVDNVHPHRFRRTFATNLYNRGMDVHEIQRLMGHKNVQTTLGYIYTDDNSIMASYHKYAA